MRGDPLYTSAIDLRLRSGSPAIGRGENARFPYDLAGKDLSSITRWDSGA